MPLGVIRQRFPRFTQEHSGNSQILELDSLPFSQTMKPSDGSGQPSATANYRSQVNLARIK